MDGQLIGAPALDDPQWQQTIDALAEKALQLGSNVVDVAGLLDEMAAKAAQQRGLIEAARSGADQVNAANDSVMMAARDVAVGAQQTMTVVSCSVERVRKAGLRTREVATWVHDLSARMVAIEDSLKAINTSNLEITSIARQVNILAINAKIEASRAGEAGRGFAFLADAVKDLAKRTTATAELIEGGLQKLTGGIVGLRDEAAGISNIASEVISDTKDTDALLSDIPIKIKESAVAADEISARAEQVQTATRN
ncbi:MAG: methyl-accepting chemotaxis protein, partial [Deltaproteobacteria bacterium]